MVLLLTLVCTYPFGLEFCLDICPGNGASWVALVVKNLPVNTGDVGDSSSRKDPPEEGVATHSGILAWRTPWTEDLMGYHPQGHRELDMTAVTWHTSTCPGMGFLDHMVALFLVF